MIATKFKGLSNQEYATNQMLTIMMIAWKKVTENDHKSEFWPSLFTGCATKVIWQTYITIRDYNTADFNQRK